MNFTLIILALNEIEGMKNTLPRIQKDWVDEIIIVDGGSTDGSIEYAKALGFTVMPQKGKGVLAGYLEGLEAARGDAVILFTPDGNCIPERIPDLVKKMREGYDMVIVSRYLGDARSIDDTIITGFGNWMFTSLVNLLFRANYTDVLGIYRAFRKEIFKTLHLDTEMKSAVNTQLCIRCVKQGMRVDEIPGDEPARIGGVSSRSILRHGFMEFVTIFSEFLMPKKTKSEGSEQSASVPKR